MNTLRLGLIVNPIAGIGGSLGLKGSDGEEVRQLVQAGSPEVGKLSRSSQRLQRTLSMLRSNKEHFDILCGSGPMGEAPLAQCELAYRVIDDSLTQETCAEDTQSVARQLVEAAVDVILFVGGDGTARDIFDAVGQSVPVLGIPAGVKMHSGVFAVSPEAAAELLLDLAAGHLVGVSPQEVRDIDEQAFREDRVVTRYYGHLLVPGQGKFLQHTKVGGRESVELAAVDIAAYVVEEMEEGNIYFIGPGSTTGAILDELGLANTLLGVDVVRGGQLLAADANERQLLELMENQTGTVKIVVTATGRQGFVFGRGNQQFSPEVITGVGKENLIIVASRTKLLELEQRPLLVDTNDLALDTHLCGLYRIVTGYADHILYRVDRVP